MRIWLDFGQLHVWRLLARDGLDGVSWPNKQPSVEVIRPADFRAYYFFCCRDCLQQRKRCWSQRDHLVRPRNDDLKSLSLSVQFLGIIVKIRLIQGFEVLFHNPDFSENLTCV